MPRTAWISLPTGPLRSENPALGKTFSRWDESRASRVAVAAWSFLEGSVWFVVPDFILLPLGVIDPDRYRQWAWLALKSSLAGIAVLWVLCCLVPTAMARLIYSLPCTYPGMGDCVAELGTRLGPAVGVFQPWSSVPVKVWALVAVERLEWRLLPFLFFAGLGRATRMFFVAWLGSMLGRRWPKIAGPWWAVAYVVLFFWGLHLVSRPFQ